MPPTHPDLSIRFEIAKLEERVRDLEIAFARVRSEMQAEISDGFQGVHRHLQSAIPAAVEASLVSVKLDLAKLLEKATEAEMYRKIREKIEQEEKDELAKQKTRGEISLTDIEVKNKYRAPVVVACIVPISTVFAAITAALLKGHS